VSELLDLDGYGAYVWPSYAVTFLVLALAIVFSLRAHTRAKGELRRLEDEAP
jgi:heme exporter protein CcmD